MDGFITALTTFTSNNLLTIVTVVLAYLGGYSAAKINRKNKIADIVMHCMERYDVISAAKVGITNEDEAYKYYRRYFGLKSDQFDYWLAGLVDAENISSWFYSTMRYFEQHRVVKFQGPNGAGEVSIVEGWRACAGGHETQNVSFVHLIEELQRIAALEVSAEEKHDELLGVLAALEDLQKHFRAFTDVNFIFRSIRSKDMAAFRRMYKRHYRRAVQRAAIQEQVSGRV